MPVQFKRTSRRDALPARLVNVDETDVYTMGLDFCKLMHAVRWWQERLPASVSGVAFNCAGVGYCNLAINVSAGAKDEVVKSIKDLKTICPRQCTFHHYIVIAVV